MQIRSTSPIYKCWESARARGAFLGTLDDFIAEVGQHPGFGMELRRKNPREMITKENHHWILPRPKDEEILLCIREGAIAEAGEKCPYKNSEIGKRCAWLAGHYDKHGLEAWYIAGD